MNVVAWTEISAPEIARKRYSRTVEPEVMHLERYRVPDHLEEVLSRANSPESTLFCHRHPNLQSREAEIVVGQTQSRVLRGQVEQHDLEAVQDYSSTPAPLYPKPRALHRVTQAVWVVKVASQPRAYLPIPAT